MNRVRHPEIIPLELAEVWVNRGTLWEWSQDPDFPLALREGLQTLHVGQGFMRGRKPVPALISGFEGVFLSGGRVENDVFRDRLSGLPFPVLFAEDPVFAGTRGGLAWLRSHASAGWAADLGNSQLKLAVPGRQWVFPRDWTRLPIPNQVSPAQLPSQCRRLREFLALGLQSALVDCGLIPQALVFALPARLADDGTPASSSYAGMQKDTKLLPDALELAGLVQVPLYVFNDAELAALCALFDDRLATLRKILVLTLGFGIGAALIHRVNAGVPTSEPATA